MDFLFNKLIPPCSDSLIILQPVSKTFINGLAQKYSDFYPSQLKNFLEKEIFFKCISEINALLAIHWPCFPAFFLGYFLSCFSCGCSFCIPYICLNDAENMLFHLLQQQNNSVFSPKGMEISLQKHCSTSWIQIKIGDYCEMKSLWKGISQKDNSLL